VQVLNPRCAGMDVHKKSVTVRRISRDAAGGAVEQTRTFCTMTIHLLELADWLAEGGVTHVAMESTGDYWRPVYNLLEGQFELLVVNAAHIKHVPGRKTDANDAEWIAELLQHGLLRPSFIPPAPQRDLRDMTRHRANLVRERATLCNRIQKLLEGANVKLASVATDVLGVSGRAMLERIAAGESDAVFLAGLARGRLREKTEALQEALTGRVKPHHRLILRQLLIQIDSLDASIGEMDAAIEAACAPFERMVGHLDTIPGVARQSAEVVLAEIGTDLSRFPSDGHLTAWAGTAPGNNVSAGKRLSGRTRPGNQALKKALVTAAHAAAKTRGTYLSAQYHRLAGRIGKKRAILAVANSILTIAYHLITRDEDYRELGGNYFDERHKDTLCERLVKRLNKLGYDVNLELRTVPAAA
jgi:transposase